VSNDNPPRARLADFDFITTISNPGQKLLSSAQMEGGTIWFKAPELLIPEKFGKKDSLPMHLDWLSSRYARRVVGIGRFDVFFL